MFKDNVHLSLPTNPSNQLHCPFLLRHLKPILVMNIDKILRGELVVKIPITREKWVRMVANKITLHENTTFTFQQDSFKLLIFTPTREDWGNIFQSEMNGNKINGGLQKRKVDQGWLTFHQLSLNSSGSRKKEKSNDKKFLDCGVQMRVWRGESWMGVEAQGEGK